MGKYHLMIGFILFLILAYFLLEEFIVFVSEPYLPYCDGDPDGKKR